MAKNVVQNCTDRRKRIAEAVKAGTPKWQIVRDEGCSYALVDHACREHKVNLRETVNQRELVQIVGEIVNTEKTLESLAKKYNMARGNIGRINKWCKESKLKTIMPHRQRGRPRKKN